MKKIFFIILLMAAFLGMEAQEPLNYTQKLDSVVGSDDFDWSRWKKVFTYNVEDAVIQDDTYSWENGVWTLNRSTLTDILNSLYCGNLMAALDDLGFATTTDALDFFKDIQSRLYAA